jgi:hypothetical protein
LSVKNLRQALNDGDLKFKPWLTNFSPEIFEVDFSNVIKGRGSALYLDPETFYKNTFLTQRMNDVINSCLARTASLNNRGTIYLATGFGGGKSHLLTLIYHIFNSGTVPDPQLLSNLSLPKVPKTQIIALDGHNLTYPLSDSEELSSILKDTKEDTVKALEGKETPIVILVDELVVYLAKLSEAQRRQEMAHLHTLISSINTTNNCVILISNPKGAGVYGKDVETLDALLNQTRTSSISEDVTSLLGRVSQPIVPVQKEDFVSILRKRLIDEINPTTAKEVENYLGRRLNIDFSNHYPFHPLLIDVLYNRISLFVDFQKTRDVLKVIALAIKGILQQPESIDFYVISPSDFLFSEPDLRDLLTNETVFGTDLEQAVTEDVIEAAQKVDGKQFGRYSRIASTIYLYSLHPEPLKRGVTIEEAFHSLTDVISKDDLEKLIHKFYSDHSTFIWFEGGKYLFKSRQNVPNMIKTRANQVLRKETQKYIEDTLFTTIFTKSSDSYCVFYRAENYTAAPNSLNVAVPLYYEDIDKTTNTVLSINAPKKNAAIVLCPDVSQQGTVEFYSKYVLGAERVKKEVKGDKTLLEEAKKLGEQYEAQGLQSFKGMYTQVKFLQGTALRETNIQPMTGSTIKDALVKRLRVVQKVVDITQINPKTYLAPLLGSRKSAQVRILFDNVESMSSIPYSSRNELRRVISQGVYEGHIGLLRGALSNNAILTGNEKIHIRTIENISVNEGDTVLTFKYALELQEKLDEINKPPAPPGGPITPPGGPITPPGGPITPPGGPITPPGGPITPPEEYDSDTFVCDAGDLYKILNEKLTMLLLENSEAKADVVFIGSINGKLSAKDLGEIRSIVDLADGLSKASILLGDVKVNATIYKKR